ncbi:hypothetical protein LPA44_08060 [Halobacterium sp. KA-4]|jgi:hypothetical protein|uniref:hypothetical protein n=1 Tax=Halobacterium sp. KA-4 TaxID=2896367 RepID=UPI001E5FAA2D|nr:hypothetical protein [Halobacterium sp. KA-4]MCD2199847.1 hypothetical protein [Halobacterium sp. KA-4]
MKRRMVLATAAVLGSGALAGCLGGNSAPANETTTGSPTTDAVPPDCQPLPDVEGLPARPESLTADSVASYVEQFETTYAVAENEEYEDATIARTSDVQQADGRYEVALDVEIELATRGTEAPADATEYRARYLVYENRLVRERRGVAGGRVLSRQCWTSEAA